MSQQLSDKRTLWRRLKDYYVVYELRTSLYTLEPWEKRVASKFTLHFCCSIIVTRINSKQILFSCSSFPWLDMHPTYTFQDGSRVYFRTSTFCKMSSHSSHTKFRLQFFLERSLDELVDVCKWIKLFIQWKNRQN